MVIQRIQSVLLLLAIAALVVACVCIPLPRLDQAPALHVYNLVPVLIINILAAVLFLIDIFLFKNLKLQMRVASLAITMTVVFAGLGALMVMLRPDMNGTSWVWPTVLAAVAVAFGAWGRSRMKADYLLLRSQDSLWR